jgi:HEAT repeat protein
MKAVRKMPRADVVRVVPRIAEFGEAAGDVLIDGLAAKKTFVRQSAALALGYLKLRRAVVPLLHLLGSEPTEVWREVARVLGEFGTGAFRALSRGVKDPKGDADRFTLALAHLANNGCAKQVEQLAADRDARTADVARLALTLRDRARQGAAEVRGERPLSGDDAVRAFSQRFYAELAGTAPDIDLVDVVE